MSPKLPTPAQQLEVFLAKYDPAVRAQARRALAKMRRLLPGTLEIVYDNYNALVIGFGPTDRASDAICSIALYPRWVTLFFLYGADLTDPTRRLQGSGKQVRQVRLQDAATLDDPEIRALLNQALHRAKSPVNPKQKRRLLIKSISPKQRPRRPF
ncbi:MAG TPA: hypothetical protein VJP87_10075 [Candidatus Acidoferrales bacterium]|nr:hypothetical protein [Candidatus Acidoferrales bacterium]